MSRLPESLYPAFLDLRNTRVLMVGGGDVALRKAATLLECGARVTVVAPEIDPAFMRLKTNGSLRAVRRKFRVGDVAGQRLVFAATNDPELNRRVAELAQKRGIFVNVAAPPDAGDMQVPATVRRGKFVLAVSTGGASAALSQYWRKKLELAAGPEWGEFVELLDELRVRALGEIPDAEKRRDVLRKLGDPKWAQKIRKLGRLKTRSEMLKLFQLRARTGKR